MSYFGTWECPSCKSTWTGSIGWQYPTEEQLPKMLHNICGCDGLIEGAMTPIISSSMMDFKSTKTRVEKMLPKAIEHFTTRLSDKMTEQDVKDWNYFSETLKVHSLEIPGKLVELMKIVNDRNS